MKVLFINSNMMKEPFPVIPLGLCYVASSIPGHHTRFLDLTFSQCPEKDITDSIRVFNPEVICIGIRNIGNMDYNNAVFYLDELRSRIVNTIKNTSRSPIVIGGSAINISPERIYEYFDVDYAIWGEGEKSLANLLTAINNDNNMSKIEGLIYKRNGNLINNGIARLSDLEEMNFSNISQFINTDKYARFSGKINVQSKRGCNQDCIYCIYNKIEGESFRLRSPEKVIDEVAMEINNTGIKSVEFVDSVFNIPQNHAINICKEIIKKKVKANFSASNINPKFVNQHLIEMMEEAGFNELTISPESASDNVLCGLRKGFNKEDIINCLSIVRESKIYISWSFLFGGPGETKQTVDETIDFIKSDLPKNHIAFVMCAIRLQEGADIVQEAIKEGKITPETDLLYPVFYHSKLVDPEYITNQINSLKNNEPNVFTPKGAKMGIFMKMLWIIVEMILKKISSKRPIWRILISINKMKLFLKGNLYKSIFI